MNLLSIIQQLRDFDTALLANTIGYIDPTPPEQFYMAGSIQSVTPTEGPSVGVAVTCEVDTSTPGNETVLDPYWQLLEQMEEMAEPAIFVLKAAGSRPQHECIIGDGMAKVLTSVGCAAVVTDGGVRDVSGILTTGLAVYCKGTTIHHTALRFRAANQPIEIGGITVKTGDVIHANEEGVITIPQSCLEKLPAAAVKMRAFEHEVHCAFRRSDISLKDKRDYVGKVFAKYGFENVQI